MPLKEVPLKKASPPITVELAFERSTKGTHVFTAAEESAPVPTLYVRKVAFEKAPERITLTIVPAE